MKKKIYTSPMIQEFCMPVESYCQTVSVPIGQGGGPGGGDDAKQYGPVFEDEEEEEKVSSEFYKGYNPWEE